MSDETLVTWAAIESENVDDEGFLIVPTNPTPELGYIAKGPTALFASQEEAQATVSQLLARGVLPIGAVKVVPAKLQHIRLLQIKTSDDDKEPEKKSSLILTP